MPRRLSNPPPREGIGQCPTLYYPNNSEQMTEIFIIAAWNIVCAFRQCLLVHCLEGATDVHKYMPQTLDGLELSQQHPEVRHVRPCYCCVHGSLCL